MNTEPDTRCPRCDKPPSFCVCDRISPQETRTRVLILQHPREQDRDYGTASLVLAMLPKAEKRVGLSWASLAAATGDDAADAKRWAVLYPHSLLKELPPDLKAKPVLFLDRQGDEREDKQPLDGVIVLDGSWSQAKAIWWRNAWLLKLNRAVLNPKEPSIYGKLRREPRREAVSTLEAVGDLLVANGEANEVREALRKVFRTMVQRARDAAAKSTQTGGQPAPEATDDSADEP
ncbi:MAG: tRNA-uridine aminocarboxypropyltransferase [Polyangiales bacterium]